MASLSGHTFRVHFSLDDLVRGTASDHSESGELLFTLRALQVPFGTILNDSFHKTFDQAALTPFAIPVEECPALCTMNGDRVEVFGHE